MGPDYPSLRLPLDHRYFLVTVPHELLINAAGQRMDVACEGEQHAHKLFTRTSWVADCVWGGTNLPTPQLAELNADSLGRRRLLVINRDLIGDHRIEGEERAHGLAAFADYLARCLDLNVRASVRELDY